LIVRKVVYPQGKQQIDEAFDIGKKMARTIELNEIVYTHPLILSQVMARLSLILPEGERARSILMRIHQLLGRGSRTNMNLYLPLLLSS
jgi:hypothetical protein